MTPEKAYSILEAIAEINNRGDKLIKCVKSDEEKADDETAAEIADERKERLSPFSFDKCNIQPGEKIEFYNNPEIICTVVDNKNVEYQGKVYSLSALATILSGSKWGVAGPRYFKYKGKLLSELRAEIEGRA